MSTPNDQLPPMNGTIIGSYTLQDSIGLGGTATVFKALCTERGTIAVKILHPGKLTPIDGKRFEREFRAMKRLSHPNIIQVHQIGQYKRYPWISMEMVSGGDFNRLIHQWNDVENPSEEKYAEIHAALRQICSALQHIHKSNMIHRDLKPSNILLTEDGNPKITDFGGVKGTAHTVATELTKLGSLVGTVAFMAPEQILGETLDPRTDLYALGAILYMSLTGQKPFEAKTMAEYLAKHLSQTPVHPCEVNPEIPETLGDICVKLLQKSPDDRFNSATELLQALKASQIVKIPIGLEHVLSDSIKWINNNPTGILWLQARRGQGLRDGLRYLIEFFAPTETIVQRHFIKPTSNAHHLYICTNHDKPSSEFIEAISLRIHDGTPTTIIVHSTEQWATLTTSLMCKHHILSFPALTIESIQKIVRSIGIMAPLNRLLSEHLRTTYQGRREYVVDVVEHQKEALKKVRSSKGTTITSLQHVPISTLCIEHQHAMWQQIPASLYPYLSAFIIYHEPLSIRVIPKLFGQPLIKLQPILEWLVNRNWLQRLDSDTDSSLEISPDRLPDVLYQLIPENLRGSWHRRIAAFIQQKPRLQKVDRQNIVHHLSSIPDYQAALPQYWYLMNHWSNQNEWEEIVELTRLLESERLLTLSAIEHLILIERAHFETRDYAKAITYNQTIQTKSPNPSQIEHAALRYFLYQHIDHPFAIDDDDIDSILTASSNTLHRQVTHIRACQHLIFGRLERAKQLWSILDDRPMDQWTHQADLGLVFLDDIQYTTNHFITKMRDRPEFHFDRWHRWYLEKLIVLGQWDSLLSHLSNRSAFSLNTILDEVFACWADFLMGNTARSKERLSAINARLESNDKPYDVGLLLHISRLKKRLNITLELPKIRWSTLARTIEDVRSQWNSIQGSHPNLDAFKLSWQKDFSLLDQAVQAQTSEQRTLIWNQLSPNSWGVQIQILSIFLNQDPQSNWTENHEHLFLKCARNITGDLHHWK